MCQMSDGFRNFVVSNWPKADESERSWRYRIVEDEKNLVFSSNGDTVTVALAEDLVLVRASKNGAEKVVFIALASEGYLKPTTRGEERVILRGEEVVFRMPKTDGWLNVSTLKVKGKVKAKPETEAIPEQRECVSQVAEAFVRALKGHKTPEELDEMTWAQLTAFCQGKFSPVGMKRSEVIDLLLKLQIEKTEENSDKADADMAQPVDVEGSDEVIETEDEDSDEDAEGETPEAVVSNDAKADAEANQGESVMSKVFINPNRELNEAQLGQIKAQLGEVEIVAAPISVPNALGVEDKPELGLAGQAGFDSAFGYPEFDFWYPTGLGIAAAATMAALHGARGSSFPEIAIFGGPPEFGFVGTVNLDKVRNTARELRYGQAESNSVFGKVLVLNFSHPITEPQKAEIAALVGVSVEELEIREGLSRQYKAETAEGLAAEVRQQVNDAKVSEAEWQSATIVVNLPAHSGGAMIALSEMHGRMGYFPNALRIERSDDGFHFSEVVELEKIRLAALTRDRNREAEATNATLDKFVEWLNATEDFVAWDMPRTSLDGKTIRMKSGGQIYVIEVSSARIEEIEKVTLEGDFLQKVMTIALGAVRRWASVPEDEAHRKAAKVAEFVGEKLATMSGDSVELSKDRVKWMYWQLHPATSLGYISGDADVELWHQLGRLYK